MLIGGGRLKLGVGWERCGNRRAASHLVARQYELDILRLLNEQSSGFNIMMDAYAQDPCCHAEVGGFEARTYGMLDGIQELLVISGKEFVVNIDRDNDEGLPTFEYKNRVISMRTPEAELNQIIMQLGIPHSPTLLQSVDPLLNFANLFLPPLLLLPLILPHTHSS